MMKYDVIVVGGGPAGAVAARDCAVAGLETVILEKKYFPRPKPCAGGVTAAAINLLNVPVPPEVVEARCSSFRSFYGDRCVEIDLDREFMIVVSREVFDLWLISLAQSAGAELRQGEKVVSVDTTREGVSVRTPGGVYTGRLVIGADGVHSTVAKTVRPPLKKNDLAFCVCSDIVTGDRESGWQEGIDVHYGPLPMSYSWVFPKRGRLSVGLGGWLAGIANVRETFMEFLRVKNLPGDQGIRGYHIPLGGVPRPVVADGVILAGDAAGFADPFTGEGIRYAIASGRLAAATAVSLISRGASLNRVNLEIYERNWSHQFGAELKNALFIARLFKHFPTALFGLYFSCREPFQKSLEILQGRLEYRQLYRWLLWRIPGLFCRRITAESVNSFSLR